MSEITLNPQHRVIDLRKVDDFQAWHLPESINLPLTSVGPHTTSPFSDAAVLEAQWVELEQIFRDGRLVSDLRPHHVLIVCYDGDTARVATSVLRAKGLEADSVRGGYRSLKMYGIGSETPVTTTVTKPIAASVSVSAVPLD